MYRLGQQLVMSELYNKVRKADSDVPVRVEKLEDTWYVYQRKVGPYWVLCTKFDWPTVWVPKSMEVEPSEYYVEIEGLPYRFGWTLTDCQRMRDLNTVQDLAPKPQDIKNNEVPQELRNKPNEPVKEETPEDFYKLEDDEVQTTERRSFASLVIPTAEEVLSELHELTKPKGKLENLAINSYLAKHLVK